MLDGYLTRTGKLFTSFCFFKTSRFYDSSHLNMCAINRSCVAQADAVKASTCFWIYDPIPIINELLTIMLNVEAG